MMHPVSEDLRAIGPVDRVMVGTDRSETASRAVEWAAAFAERFGAELHVVQVVIPEHPADTEHGAAEATRARSAADELRNYTTQLAGERGHAHVVVDDDPAMAIVRSSEDHGADVLVVGNAGMAGRKEFLLGNVPNRISHNARCTIVIVNTTNGVAAAVRSPGLGDAVRASTEPPVTEPHLVARGTKIAAVFAKHGLRELFARPDQEGATGRRRQAKRLRAALEELGPTFCKLGQILSTRPDLLPSEFIEELATLQDDVPPLTEAEVVVVMEQELGVPWEDLFDTVEPKPLAAGTIAQVHRATLADGERVVIKVQRPDARGLIEQDLALLEVFAEKAARRPHLKLVIDMEAVFAHLSGSLQRELDFRQEAANMQRIAEVLEPFPRLAVPVVYTAFSTSRLLVMHDVGGGPIDTAPEDDARREAARQLLESFYRQIMVAGFFHADPDLDPFEVAGRFLMRNVMRDIRARVDPKALFYGTQKLRVRLTRVLEAVERMIGARPGQKLEINFRAAPLEETVRRAGRHLALGITAAAGILASGLTALSPRLPGWVPVTFGITGGVLTVALLFDLFRRRR